MQIGISLEPVFRHFNDIQEVLEILLSEQLGFNFIELHSHLIDKYLLIFLELSERLGIRYSIHLPHSASTVKVNFCSAKKVDIETADIWLAKSIEFAKKLKSSEITLHPDLPFECSKEEARTILAQHITKHIDSLDKNQVILIENMPSFKYALSTPVQILDFITTLDKKRIGINLDLAHYFVLKKPEIPKKLGKLLREVHLSDIKENNDSHLPLGKGELSIKESIEILKQLKYKNYIILEVLTSNIEDILESKRLLEKYLFF